MACQHQRVRWQGHDGWGAYYECLDCGRTLVAFEEGGEGDE